MIKPFIQEFVFSDLDKNVNFIHVTDRHSAMSIIESGFFFENPLYKTADQVSGQDVWLDFWWHQRKFYGNQIIVLSMSKLLLDHCSLLCKTELNSKINSFQLLNANKIERFVDGEIQLNIANIFVKGYIDLVEGIIYKNEKFDPNYYKQIELNLKKYKELINSEKKEKTR